MQYKINYKNQYGGDIKNIIVYCHPKKITMENNNHWMMEIFKEIINDNYPHDTINFDTIDILPGGTIQDNVFSQTFINEHANTYDGIFVPDCAGPWNYLQQIANKDDWPNQTAKNNMLRNMIKNITKMLKPNGILFISKILTDTFYKIIVDVLNKLNFEIIDKNFILYEESYSSPFIYAIKQ